MYKYIFLAALLPLALIIVACTTEIEVEKIVEVTGEVPVSSATVATEPRKLNLLVGPAGTQKQYSDSSFGT